MLIFENGLRIVFDDGLKRNKGIINHQLLSVDGNSKRYMVDVCEQGIISERQVVSENQILQVYIKDTYGLDIWVKIEALYSSYPHGTIIGPDTIYKHPVDGRKSGRYPWSEYVTYMSNDEKAVKAAMQEWKITPKKVIFNGPATVVIWKDGTKTIVKKSENDTDDREKAVMYAILKKEFGSRAKMNRYLKHFKEVESNEEKEEAGSC